MIKRLVRRFTIPGRINATERKLEKAKSRLKSVQSIMGGTIINKNRAAVALEAAKKSTKFREKIDKLNRKINELKEKNKKKNL